MIATIGRMTTVISATFSRHIARAQDERKIQSCGVRIADTEIYSLALWLITIFKRTKISVPGEKGEKND